MKASLSLIVITVEGIFEGEAAALNCLLEGGVAALHVRKPCATEAEVRSLLEQIDKRFHDRIVLHDWFSLIASFRLKGVHLNRRNPIRPQQEVSSLSRSCHSLAELAYIGDFSYVFLSPIFDSISKKGYTQAFAKEDLLSSKANGLINEKIVALGGINAATIPLAASYGFGGVAVLGALWGNFSKSKNENALMKRFDELLSIAQKQ
ncbi:MAG: thiamine phosphate synthase [Prevotellaceae bacterium]|jgi:thiamine-phosphate pyrophosphorylase|nr:thiamine phosphate synthase [Prevotellaceae bacterium]